MEVEMSRTVCVLSETRGSARIQAGKVSPVVRIDRIGDSIGCRCYAWEKWWSRVGKRFYKRLKSKAQRRADKVVVERGWYES